MKKHIWIVSILALFFGFPSLPAQAAVFSDVPSTHWAAKEISYLSDQGILKGGSNGKYNKDAPVTKAQAAAILVRAQKLSLSNVPDPGFKDVPKTHPFYKEIAAAVHAGWFSKGTEFKPDNLLKRIEMAKITQLAFHIQGTVAVQWEDMNDSYPGSAHVTPLLASGITSGYTATSFNPSAKVTRAQFAVFTARAMNPAFRLKVVTYPKQAAEDIYYPQFTDTTGQHNFSLLNQLFQERGADLKSTRDEIMKLAQEDDWMGEYYHYEVSYTVPRADLRYISVLFESYQYTGGAHGYEMLFAENVDVQNGLFMRLDDLALKPDYEWRVVDRINQMNHEFYYSFGGPENLDELQYQFYMKPDSLVMFLNPYEYAPYAAGIRQFPIPYSMIR